MNVRDTSLTKIKSGSSCGVSIVTRTITTTTTTTTQLIAEQLPTLNNRKRLALKSKLDPERSLWYSFSKKLMHLKGN
jgi:hypothetical protein